MIMAKLIKAFLLKIWTGKPDFFIKIDNTFWKTNFTCWHYNYRGYSLWDWSNLTNFKSLISTRALHDVKFLQCCLFSFSRAHLQFWFLSKFLKLFVKLKKIKVCNYRNQPNSSGDNPSQSEKKYWNFATF